MSRNPDVWAALPQTPSFLELASATKPQGRDYVVPLHLRVGESTGRAALRRDNRTFVIGD
jgi:hypothetical protein